MKTIAICNHKGGVGKTALSMAIAEGLHRKGNRRITEEHKHRVKLMKVASPFLKKGVFRSK